RDGGSVARLWGGTPWSGARQWQGVLRDMFEHWMDAVGARARVPAGWEKAIEEDPHGQVLRRAGLSYEGLSEFSVVERWSVESLIGFVYSTSFLNRAALGHHAR